MDHVALCIELSRDPGTVLSADTEDQRSRGGHRARSTGTHAAYGPTVLPGLAARELFKAPAARAGGEQDHHGRSNTREGHGTECTG